MARSRAMVLFKNMTRSAKPGALYPCDTLIPHDALEYLVRSMPLMLSKMMAHSKAMALSVHLVRSIPLILSWVLAHFVKMGLSILLVRSTASGAFCIIGSIYTPDTIVKDGSIV